MSSRGSRSIFGQTVRGHKLVCDTRKEGDDNAKRSPAGKVYPWVKGIEVRSGSWRS